MTGCMIIHGSYQLQKQFTRRLKVIFLTANRSHFPNDPNTFPNESGFQFRKDKV